MLIKRKLEIILLTISLVVLIIAGVVSFPKKTEGVINDHPVEIPKSTTLDEKISYYAELYSVDEGLARKIMSCESGLKPHALNKNYRNGEVWSTDWGYGQINDYYHQDSMAELGLDIYEPDDNLKYTFILLSTAGTTPWDASRHCWEK